MLTQQDINGLREFEGRGLPVLSVYLSVDPGVGALRSISTRIKDLVYPIRHQADDLSRDAARSLSADVDAVLAMDGRIYPDGAGVAIFASSGNGLFETMSLPVPVRSRAIVGSSPYLRPLDAMLEELHRFCAVVIEKRTADIFRFYMSELSSWEELREEELRKTNYGGFSGYEERRVRAHAEEVALRHFRDVATRLRALLGEEGFDKLLIGGQRESVDGLVAALPTDVADRLAGTFSIDTHTMTPAIVRDHCERLAAESDRAEEAKLVEDLIDVAKGGGLAVLGMEETLAAVNQRAVEVLVVDTSISAPGVRCGSCGWLAADVGDECIVCGEATMQEADLVDALATAVRNSSGTVRHILAATPLGAYQVGASVRFATPSL